VAFEERPFAMMKIFQEQCDADMVAYDFVSHDDGVRQNSNLYVRASSIEETQDLLLISRE
jgi:hypothetical protein